MFLSKVYVITILPHLTCGSPTIPSRQKQLEVPLLNTWQWASIPHGLGLHESKKNNTIITIVNNKVETLYYTIVSIKR